ncbi:unnamed protein product, partial [Cylicostephanus goldi]
MGKLQKSTPQTESFEEQRSPLSELPEDFERFEETSTPTKFYGFPSTAAYEGPMEITSPTEDIKDEPIVHHVSVYHSGRSDEPLTKEEKTSDTTADIARALGDKIMNLFAKQSFPYDYLSLEQYKGPLEATSRKEDIEPQPIQNVVSLYHEGRSDIKQEPAAASQGETTLHVKDIYYDDSSILSPESRLEAAFLYSDKSGFTDAAVAQAEIQAVPPQKQDEEQRRSYDVYEAKPSITGESSSETTTTEKHFISHDERPLITRQSAAKVEEEAAAQSVDSHHNGYPEKPQVDESKENETVLNIKDVYFDYPTTAAYEGPLE